MAIVCATLRSLHDYLAAFIACFYCLLSLLASRSPATVQPGEKLRKRFTKTYFLLVENLIFLR
jgi:hypothetical protein